MKKNLEMCRLLLNKKSEVNLLDNKGKYALLHILESAEMHLTQPPRPVQEDNLEIIELLLASGAQVDIFAEESSARSILRKIAGSLIVSHKFTVFCNSLHVYDTGVDQ